MLDPKHERTHRLISKGYPLDVLPTEEELERVDQMNPYECPRRYCWHWRSLGHEWDIPPSEGCDADRKKINYLGNPIPRMHNSPCKRAHPSSPHDHFETRDPAMLEDGIPNGRWDCPEDE